MALPALLATPMGAALASGVIDAGKTLIDRIFPDKEKQAQERAAAELELTRVLHEGRLEEARVRLSAIMAEAQSADPWTSRARPSFLYVMYAMILWSIPMGVLSYFKPDAAVAVAAGMKAWLAAIPSDLWTVFGIGYTGYTAMRSIFDKPKKAKGGA